MLFEGRLWPGKNHKKKNYATILPERVWNVTVTKILAAKAVSSNDTCCAVHKQNWRNITRTASDRFHLLINNTYVFFFYYLSIILQIESCLLT